MTDRQYYQRAAMTLLMVVAAVLGILLLLTTARIFLLFFVAILIAIPLRRGGTWLATQTPLSASYGAVLTALLFTAVIGLLGWYTAPHLLERSDELATVAQDTVMQIRNQLENEQWGQLLLERVPDPRRMDFIGGVGNPINTITSIFSSTVGPLVTVVVLFILGLMFAIDPDLYQNIVVQALPDSKKSIAQDYFAETNHALAYWLLARLTSMIVIGVLTWLGLMLLGVPLAITLAILAGLLSFIPNIGPILSVIPAVLVAFSQSPTNAVYVLVLYVVLQTVESYFITPYVEKRTVSLPPALTIFVQLVLTLLVGLVGAMVAAPLIVAAMMGVKIIYYPYVLGKPKDTLDLHLGPRN